MIEALRLSDLPDSRMLVRCDSCRTAANLSVPALLDSYGSVSVAELKAALQHKFCRAGGSSVSTCPLRVTPGGREAGDGEAAAR